MCFADIREYSAVWPCFEEFRPQAVMHLAAQASIGNSEGDPRKDLQVNGVGTINVLEAAVHANVKHFVFASTSAVYANSYQVMKENSKLAGDSPYAISKLAAEQYIRLMLPQAVILRLANVYGPRQVPIGENQVIARMIRHFRDKERFCIFGDGKQERDFVYVKDVAEAFYRALTAKPGTYNIASGETKSVNEVSKMVADAWGFLNYSWDRDETRHDARRRVWMDNFLAERDLHWVPETSLEEGIARTMDWWNAQ
jgi:UDP-glucose 4-epimerase